MTKARVRRFAVALTVLLLSAFFPRHSQAQAALLMEEPYGFFGALNPTGHTALYFARICADSPVKLRRCAPGELGSVIARYQGIAGYDWVAMPLLPYLYSVEDIDEVPQRVDKKTVQRLRTHYHEKYLGVLGAHVFEGNLVRGGWTQLVGVAFERRIYAFRFETTDQQDDALIAELNDRKNSSHFSLLYSNCADWARIVLNEYFPQVFRRTIFPDAGMTTPRQVTYKLVKYANKHPELGLSVFEIPQIPGYRRMSRMNKSVAGSLIATGYAVPITILNPYLGGAIFVDYLVRGRYPLVPKHVDVLKPEELSELGSPAGSGGNPAEAETHPAAVVETEIESRTQAAESPGIEGSLDQHEFDRRP